MTIRHDIVKARLLGCLILITLLALVFQAYGPERVLMLGQDSDVYIDALDDRANGGKSIASLKFDGQKYILDCDIIASDYQWPFCEISFSLKNTKGKGMDLSNYERVDLWAKYSTPQNFGIRFQLINFNAAYSKSDDTTSLKYNAIELFDTHAQYPQVINMRHMQVPTWWLSRGQIAPTYWGPEFNEVRGVQISTGENIPPGKYQMFIEGVEIRGKYISDRSLYLLLVSGWTLLALLLLIDLLRKTNNELHANKQRQHQLDDLNQLLHFEQHGLAERLTRDPLTGVLNRDGLAPLFNENWHIDSTQLLTLIFIDIDLFKKINDNYGHNIGDQVLLIFSQTLSENTRLQDFLARWSGGKFVLACPDTALDNGLGLAEKLRRAVERCDWPKDLKVTASFGVAQIMQGESPTDFIARADKALSTAKAQGRNCVRSSAQTLAVLSAAK